MNFEITSLWWSKSCNHDKAKVVQSRQLRWRCLHDLYRRLYLQIHRWILFHSMKCCIMIGQWLSILAPKKGVSRLTHLLATRMVCQSIESQQPQNQHNIAVMIVVLHVIHRASYMMILHFFLPQGPGCYYEHHDGCSGVNVSCMFVCNTDFVTVSCLISFGKDVLCSYFLPIFDGEWFRR